MRVAVVGVAGVGFYHVLIVPRVAEYELVAICDVDAEALERVAAAAEKELDGRTIQRFSDPADLYSSGAVDAVIIATPNSMHAAHVRQGLDAGLHVYCEKPLGITVGECRELAAHARASGRRIQVGFQHRFQHAYREAHRIVASGELGPLYRADLYATHWFRPHSYFAKAPWRGRWAQAGGGVMMMQAIHQLDAYGWICGTPSRVTAQAWRTRPDSEVEDEATALLEFPSGARGVVSASTVSPTGQSRMEIHGDHGSLFVHGDRLRRGTLPDAASSILATETNPFAVVPVEKSEIEIEEGAPASFDAYIAECHRDFARAIAEGRDPLNHPDEATRAVELANAMYLSAVTDAPVDLPLDAAAYDELFGRLRSGEASLRTLEGARV